MDKRFTSDSVKALREELNKTLEAFGRKHNMEITLGNAVFDPINCNFQLKVKLLPTDDFDPALAFWSVHCGRIGFDPADLGKQFTLGNTLYKLTGYNPNEKKNCLIITRLQDGMRFSASPEQVYNAIYGPKDAKQLLQDAMLQAKHNWDSNCQEIGLNPGDFGRTISIGGQLVVLCGYDGSAKRKPICAKDLNTKADLRFSVQSVKKALDQYRP